MNTLKLTAIATIVAVSALVACSTPADGTGSSENAATADIDRMFRRPNGNFDLWCTNGTKEEDVPAAKINANEACGGGATSSSSSSSSSSGAPAPSACLAATVPATAAWKKPPPASSVCTRADLQILSDTAVTGADFKGMHDAVAAANAPCAACIFTEEGAAAWGPIITTDGGTKGSVNWSSCFARGTSGSDACAEKFFHQSECGLEMCSTCGDHASEVACYSEAAGDAAKCGQYDVDAACGGAFNALNTACNDPFDVIIASCGGN